MTEQDLLNKKKEIERAKTKLSELTGEEKSLLKQLKEDWDCSSLSQAKTKIKELESTVLSLSNEITEATEHLENELSSIKEE
jgi:hypothetical protein